MNRTTLLTAVAFTGLSVAGGFAGAWAFASQDDSGEWTPATQAMQTGARSTTAGIGTSTDFSDAAEQAVHSVVHVKTSVEQGYTMSPFNPFHDFFFGFGERQMPEMTPRIVQGSGSGVII